MAGKIIRFFDKLENRVREKLSHYPVLYAFIGGVGLVLFWRGVWHIADDINLTSIMSIIVGFVILLTTGIFVSEFIGNKLIISGLVGEKRLAEKEESEIETEEIQLKNLQDTLSRVEKQISHLEEDMHGK